MAPVPPYTAGELTVEYFSPLGRHKMSFHQVLGADANAFQSAVRSVLTEMALRMYALSSFTGAQYRTAGSPNSFPVAGWAAINSPGTNPAPTSTDTNGEYINFAGRSGLTGRRVRLFLFGSTVGPDREMRVTAAESAGIAAIISTLQSTSQLIGAIDGTPVTWKTYVNVGINDYWTRRARGAA